MIKHVIFLILENRSFDHLLGWMSHPLYGGNPAVEGLRGAVNVSTNELIEPRYENKALGKTFRPYFVSVDDLNTDLPHDQNEVTKQMAHTAATGSFSMKGFAESFFRANASLASPFATKADCMEMLAPNAAPITAWLAKHYKVCDHWFTPIPAGTHPNRVMALAGETKIDRNALSIPEHDLVFDWAERHSLPWRVYSDGFSFLMTMRKTRVLADKDHFRDFDLFARDYQHDPEFPAVTYLEPAYLDDPFATRPNDNHPPLPMHPGEAFLLQIYRTFFGTDLARRRFEETVFVVYYDEHGGLYDHVEPLTVHTPCKADHNAWSAFSTSGPRVPALVISPLVNPGVYPDNLDHTSLLRFLGETFTDDTYSLAISERHSQAQAKLHSLRDAIDLPNNPRDVPAAPSFGPLPTRTFSAGRPAITVSHQAFLEARKEAYRAFHESLGGAQLEGVFAAPKLPR